MKLGQSKCMVLKVEIREETSPVFWNVHGVLYVLSGFGSVFGICFTEGGANQVLFGSPSSPLSEVLVLTLSLLNC